MVKINRKVGGSNPPIPTIFISGISSVWLERVIWDHEAVGSSPTSPTICIIYLDIVQFGRTLPWGGRGRGFKSLYSDHTVGVTPL